jgi:hypothetical protein
MSEELSVTPLPTSQINKVKDFCKGTTGLDFDSLPMRGKESCIVVYLTLVRLFPHADMRDLIYEASVKIATRNYQGNPEEKEFYLKQQLPYGS